MANRKRRYRRNYTSARRQNARKIKSILLTLLIFSILIAIIVSLPDSRQSRETLAGSAYVIDGDTVILDKIHIRLAGIDAPEIQQSCQIDKRDYLCGRDASKALLNKINGSTIRCEKLGLDKYGRTLATCYRGETNLNQWMVEQGWAVAYGDYRSEEATARREKRGIWAGSFEVPYQWRKDHQHPNADAETSHETRSSDVISDMIHYIKSQVVKLLNAI